ncbi:MAG: hypothetical protein JWQ04_3189 [Pedosphaera sp.]|nr:hypothetical protein [Pedosphaera sp.]
MTNTVVKRGRPWGAKTRFKGIGVMASKLGVSEEHLRLVLNSKRIGSADLHQRYKALKKNHRTL